MSTEIKRKIRVLFRRKQNNISIFLHFPASTITYYFAYFYRNNIHILHHLSSYTEKINLHIFPSLKRFYFFIEYKNNKKIFGK